MSKQKNQIFILIFIILVGLLYVYVQYLFLPQMAILKGQTNYLTERKAYLENLKDNASRLPELQEQKALLQVRADELEKRVPRDLDKPEIMLTVYNLAKAYGVTPHSLNFDQPKEEGGFTAMGLDFACSGSEGDIYTLAEEFGKGRDYIFALDSISIEPGETEVSARMKLKAYGYLK